MPVDKEKIKALAARVLKNGKVDVNKFAGGGPESRHHNGRDYTLDEYKDEKRDEIIGAAVDKALSRKYGVAPKVGDPSCLYTVTDNFGRKYRVAGNESFMADPGRYGFIVNGPVENAGVGDIYQFIDENGRPYHSVMITGFDDDGRPLVSYSSGGAPRYNPDDIMSPLVQSEARERKFNIFSPEEFSGVQSPAKTYDDYFKSVMRNYSDVMASDYKRNKRLWGDDTERVVTDSMIYGDENQPVESPDFVGDEPSYAYETYRFVGNSDDNARWEAEYGSLPKSIGVLPRVEVGLPAASRSGDDGLARGYSGGGDIPPQRDNTATRYTKSMAYVPSKPDSYDLVKDFDYDPNLLANIDLFALPEYPSTEDVKDFFSTFAKSAGMDAIRKSQKEHISKRYPYAEISDSDIDESFRHISDVMSGSGDDKILDLGDLGGNLSTNFGQRMIAVSDKKWSPYYGYSYPPIDFTLAHEISHDSDTLMPGNHLILHENKGAEDNGHDELANEKRADINGVRYLLYKNGIIDQRDGGKVKKHHIRKLRKLYPGLRPLVQMDDEQMASMLNLIADSGNGVDMSNMASEGGSLLRRFEDGGPEGEGDVKTYEQLLKEYNEAVDRRKKAWRDYNERQKKISEVIHRNSYGNPGYAYWNDPVANKLVNEQKKLDDRFEADKVLTAVEAALGKATIEKHSGTSSDLLKYPDWSNSKEGAARYLSESGVRDSQGAKDVADYFNSYASSPGFQRIIDNQAEWGKRRHPYRRIYNWPDYGKSGYTYSANNMRKGLLKNPMTTDGVFDINGGSGNGFNATGPGYHIVINAAGNPFLNQRKEEFPYWFELTHEMMHDRNYVGGGQGEALNQNTNTEPGHDSWNTEKHSDLEALRFMLYNEGIYDSRGEKDATPEDIKKLRELYPNLRPLKQMDDEKAAWMINHVADANGKFDMSNIASCGGLLRKYEGGGEIGEDDPDFIGPVISIAPRDVAARSNNKYERIGNGRYWSAYDTLVNGGATPEDSDRLARILAAQSALETGWVDRNDTNNYAGYRYNGKNMSFNSPAEFWDYHIKNLDEKWPGWRDADSVDSYYKIVNHPELGLDTKEKFLAYNRAHRDNPVYLYAPDWDNENYLGKLKSVYDRYINKYVPALGNALSGGGDIHIKKSKRGTFTAAAKKHGKSVQAFASQVLANKGNYSPAMVKKANFARNAAKWHSDGGAINKAIENGNVDVILAAINNVLKNKS